MTASMAALALVVSGCQNMPLLPGTGSSDSAASQYITSCLGGAVIGATIEYIFETARGKLGSDPKIRNKDLGKAALGGCAIGIAATAIGGVLNDRQRAKHEEALQKEAQRRAEEQRQYEVALQRADNMPARTAAEREKQSATRERLKTNYEAGLKKPTTVDLGEGATSTLAVEGPATPEGCRVFTQSVSRPPNGDVRQYDTFCPNASGQLVRVESRPNPVG